MEETLVFSRIFLYSRKFIPAKPFTLLYSLFEIFESLFRKFIVLFRETFFHSEEKWLIIGERNFIFQIS